MYYERSNAYVKPVKKRISINVFSEVNAKHDQASLPLDFSPMSYNFTLGDGILRNGCGIKEYAFRTPGTYVFRCQGIFFYKRFNADGQKDDRILIATEDCSLYEYAIYRVSKWRRVGNFTGQSVISGINYCYDNNYYFIFAGNSFQYVYNGYSITEITDSPIISTLCVYGDRVFASLGGVYSNAVWFSDDFNPTSWQVSLEAGGFIRFDDEGGKVVAVVEFLDSVYVFREYAVHRIRGYAMQEEFTVTKAYVCTGMIYGSTVAVCGDKIIFWATDGLYCFDGVDCVRIKEGITPILQYTAATKGIYYSTKYYLATRIKTKHRNLDGINNGFLVYDTKDGRVNLVVGMDIRSFAGCVTEDGEMVLAVTADSPNIGYLVDYEGSCFGVALEKYWRTPFTDFGIHGYKKRLKRIIIKSDNNLTLYVNLDGKQIRKVIKGCESEQSKRIDCPFERMSVEMVADQKECTVHYLDFEIEVL